MSNIEDILKTENGTKSLEWAVNPEVVPSLSIVQLKDGQEVAEYSAGSHGQYDEPVDADTVYDLASVSKLYTTALVLRRAQVGAIDLDARLGDYIAQQSLIDSALSVRNILSHRVNFGVYLSNYRKCRPDDYKEALLNITMPSQSSDTINYHNLGYLYLGYMLENVTGQTLDSQMAELFENLGLENTYVGNSVGERGIACPATEILADGSVIENITHDESARLHGGLAGNAGVFASARDMARFGQAWVSGEVVDQRLLGEALHDYDKSGNRPQGLGWWMRAKGGASLPQGMYSHSGFTGCSLTIDTNTSEVTAIATNRTLYGRDNTGDQAVFRSVFPQI